MPRRIHVCRVGLHFSCENRVTLFFNQVCVGMNVLARVAGIMRLAVLQRGDHRV
jgi:hypothetical protein